MEVKFITEDKKEFKPFEIKLKFETKQELENFVNKLVEGPDKEEDELFNLLNSKLDEYK